MSVKFQVQAHILKNFVDIAKALWGKMADAHEIVFDENEVTSRQLDPPKFRLLDMAIPKSSFTSYSNGSGRFRTSILLEDISPWLKRCPDTMEITGEVTSDEIYLEQGGHEINLEHINPTEEETPSITAEHKAVIRLSADTLRDAIARIDDLKNVQTSAFWATDKKFGVAASRNNRWFSGFEIPLDDDRVIKHLVKEPSAFFMAVGETESQFSFVNAATKKAELALPAVGGRAASSQPQQARSHHTVPHPVSACVSRRSHVWKEQPDHFARSATGPGVACFRSQYGSSAPAL